MSQHGESRSFAYDWLGRMTSETTPESGTSSFTFDSSGTCGGSAGSLVERVDAAGNVTCYAHDGWSRVTAITYPSGPNAAATPAKTFVYGVGAVVDGVHMTNATGRLAEAYTGPAGAKITDEGFGYDAMGRPSEFYEATPHSGGYYVGDASWWLDGQLRTMSEPLIPAITYDPDSAGRIVSVSAASGQNPVSNVSYFAGNLVNTVTYGSGDYDSYTYNNDLRMTQYTLDINGSNDIGKLTWNGNGTLASLDITDPFASGDTQNCSYTQDDLGRLTSANCGGEWAQTYTPDPFGNQSTKSGGSSPLVASFNGKNQFASVSGFVPNYDLDGDLLDNPLGQVRNAYAWDADGHLVRVEGVAQVFDALGRVVEDQQNEVLWTPWGEEFGHMNGQSAGAGDEVRLPGGGAVVYAGSSLSVYLHMDWERNWRLGSTPSRGFSWDEAYGPYGTGYAGNGWPGYTDKWNDDPDGLLEFPARYESPGLKRWLSPDPAGLAAVNPADPQSWDAYAYVGNQPLALTDPLGLVCQEDQVNQDCEPGFSQGTGGYGGGGYGGDSGGGGEFGLMGVPVDVQDGFSLVSQGGAWQQGPSWSGTIDPGMQIPFTADSNICIGCTMQYVPNLFQVSNGFDLFGPFQEPQSVATGSATGSANGSAAPAAGPLGSNGAAIEALGRGLATLAHPMEFLTANLAMAWTGAAAVGLGAGLIAAGCLDPTPFEPVTCIGGLAAGAAVALPGFGVLGAAGYFFVNSTIPAFERW